MQVFISSTYTDLQDERQAAVEVILRAGHIPAGMELFAAGDKSQMEVIRNWIDESDVFLLILGGRYGSIEPESGNSYVQIEYEYALSKGKPWFACVISNDALEERGRLDYSKFRETNNIEKLEQFRRQLISNNLVAIWKDISQIKLAIFQSLSDYIQRNEIPGWIKNNIDIEDFMVKCTQLSAENSILQSENNNYRNLGLRNIYRDFSREKFRTKLEQDHERNSGIDILQTFAPNLEYFKESLIQCLTQGIDIRLLLSWPESQAVKLREDALAKCEIDGYNSKSIRINVKNEVTSNLEILEDIYCYIGSCRQENLGSLQVRLYNSIPSISMYKINDYFLVGVFLHGRLAVNSFQLELTGIDTILANVCFGEFNRMWGIAREIMPQSLEGWRLHVETLFD